MKFVTVGKLFKFSRLQLPSVENGSNNGFLGDFVCVCVCMRIRDNVCKAPRLNA